MKRNTATIFFFLVFFSSCLAQQVYTYEKGSIIKKSGDTIKCYVPISFYYSEEIKIKLNKNSHDSTIKINEIKFLVTPFNVLENIILDKTERLMRIVNKGKIILYKYFILDIGPNPPEGGLHTYEPTDIYYAIKKDSLCYAVKKRNYKTLLLEQLKDCSDIIKKIGNKGYKYDDIEKIIDEYNKCNK